MNVFRKPNRLGSILSLLALVAGVVLPGAVPAAGSETRMTGLHVSGNKILNVDEQRIFLHGVNRAGTEYACIQGFGIFDGPSSQTSIDAMKTWNINSVRVPLNEDCWLGVNTTNASVSGTNYRVAIKNYVNLITANNMVPILELHWSAPGTEPATYQYPMPNVDHSIDFWKSVALLFKDNSAVILDLFNEPYPDFLVTASDPWVCLRDGRDACPGIGFEAVGMQELLDVVRATGATNVVLTSGLEYGNDMRQWRQFAPTDTASNLAASWHAYNFNRCASRDCWQRDTAPLANTTPIVAGEIGSITCDKYFPMVARFLEDRQQGYIAWTWNTYGPECDSEGLLNSYSGNPSVVGKPYHDYIAPLAWTFEGRGPRRVTRPELILSRSFEQPDVKPWFFQHETDVKTSFRRDHGVADDGTYSAEITVHQGNAELPWHVRLSQDRIPIRKGIPYKLQFAAKASKSRGIQVILQKSTPPYSIYDLHEVALTTDWQTFEFDFTPAQDDPYALLNFTFAQTTGNVWLDTVSLR